MYLVLDGEFRIIRGQNEHEEVIATLARGNWLGEISFTKHIPRTASAIASMPSTVMAIERTFPREILVD